ncbi:sodium-coupled neutral amino acid transporter 7-like isoform X1 [Gordionus sp. m RMFG-2023]|uniref:sodium-coupled neutral amino acid transporter 7-like isoform X1 n=2 Tax=Gordionus sp. m RMFG-2023 TaxID=3053472 RepID=UPI0031FD7865
MVYIPFIMLTKYYLHQNNHEPYSYTHKIYTQSDNFFNIFDPFNINLLMMGRPKYFPVYNILRAIPTICFLYNSHLSIVPTYYCMDQTDSSSVKKFSKSIFLNIIVCFILYNLTGIYGYISFGKEVMTYTDILTAYDPKDYKIFIAMILLAGKLVTTYPIVLFCARISILNTLPTLSPSLLSRFSFLSAEKTREMVGRIFVTLLWFGLVLSIATYVPDVSKVIPFLGSFCLLLIFVFPALALLQYLLSTNELQDEEIDDSYQSFTNGSNFGETSSQNNEMIIFGKVVSWISAKKVAYSCSVLLIILGMLLFGMVFTQSVMDTIY